MTLSGSSPKEKHPNRMSPQDPTACQARSLRVPPSHPSTPTPQNRERVPCLTRGENNQRERRKTPPQHKGKLLRKEVIQPHLPVRLPCYDFVLIAGPTFDRSLRKP